MRYYIIFDKMDGKRTFYYTAAVEECTNVALSWEHPHELVSDEITVLWDEDMKCNKMGRFISCQA